MTTEHAKAWDDWGAVDPLWAVLTDPSMKYGKWPAETFFASGRATIDSLWGTARSLGIPQQRRRALDFGCGVGRLTVALATHVDHVVGVDVAPKMVQQARGYHHGVDNVEFLEHHAQDLSEFDNASFDVVCSLLVLQHLPSDAAIEGYLGEFFRILAPGGVAIFQLPAKAPVAPLNTSLRARLRLRTRLAKGLRALGVSPALLYRYMRWQPAMTMRAIPYERVVEVIERAQRTLAWVSEPEPDVSGFVHRYYLVTR